MKGYLAIGLALVTLALSAAPAEAFGLRRRGCNNCCAPCCTPCCSPCTTCCAPVQYVDKTVTCYRPEWKERDVSCTVNRIVPREEVVPVSRTVMVPEWKDVKSTVTVMKQVPREVVQNVTCCRMVQTCVVDPCTGCSRVCCKPESYTQQVKRMVMDCVPEQKDVTTKVCSYKPTVETIQCKRIVCETKPETVTRKERFCVMVAYQTTVKVPACGTTCCQ